MLRPVVRSFGLQGGSESESFGKFKESTLAVLVSLPTGFVICAVDKQDLQGPIVNEVLSRQERHAMNPSICPRD